MIDLEPGDVIPMERFTASYNNIRLDYRKLSKGRKYAFLLLGIGSEEQPLDANKALNALGWSYDPKAATEQLKDRMAETESRS